MGVCCVCICEFPLRFSVEGFTGYFIEFVKKESRMTV